MFGLELWLTIHFPLWRCHLNGRVHCCIKDTRAARQDLTSHQNCSFTFIETISLYYRLICDWTKVCVCVWWYSAKYLLWLVSVVVVHMVKYHCLWFIHIKSLHEVVDGRQHNVNTFEKRICFFLLQWIINTLRQDNNVNINDVHFLQSLNLYLHFKKCYCSLVQLIKVCIHAEYFYGREK